MASRTAVAVLSGILVATFGPQANASPIFTITIVDPGGAMAPFHSALESHALAAGDSWGANFAGNGTLEVQISFDANIPFGSGRSFASSFVTNIGGINIFEQGAAAEMRTGFDPTGGDPDIDFVFNPNYVANILWFDLDPLGRMDPVPLDKTDAMSVFLHEYGHAFAINGFRDRSGALPPTHMSTFDALSMLDGNTVPEPSSALLLTCGIVLTLRRHARRPRVES